jgi:hypothetical protein
MARAVSVGGVFLKARHPKAPAASGMTVFAHFPHDTEYFGTGQQQSIVNLRRQS